MVLGLAMAAVAGAFGPIVRGRARSAAAPYGADVTIDTVIPSWNGARLRGVHVKLADVPGALIDLDEVDVSRGSPRKVEVKGGRVALTGEPSELAAQVEALRARLAARPESTEKAGPSTDVDFHGVSVDLGPTSAGISLHAQGVAIRRDADLVSIDAALVDATWASHHASAATAHLALRRANGTTLVEKLTTEALIADIKLEPGEAAVVAPVSNAPSESGAVGRVTHFRERIAALAPFVESKLTPDAAIELRGVKIAVTTRGHATDASATVPGESLNLGPGAVKLVREADRLSLEYASTPSSEGRAFSVKAKLPKDGEPLAVDLLGGPITLATLGVHDGDFKLEGTADSSVTADVHLELSPDGKRLSVSGKGTLEKLGFSIKAISALPVRGLKLAFSGSGFLELDGSLAHVEKGELEVGALQLKGDFDYQRLAVTKPGEAPKFKLKSSFEIPLTPCQSLVDAAPEGLMPTVSGIRMAGSLAMKGHANLDTTNLDRDYDLDWALANSCRVTEISPKLDAKRFHKPFKRTAYTPEGAPMEIESGPGAADWAAYSHISKFMETAVITCEDGRFESHDGFDHEAIKNSIRENLRTGKFVRGASTISMQLAKNLYLPRDKTVSRKLEEAILTMYLEQALTKEQIMELYLNVVELGPRVYGVEAAAAHYFHSSAGQLSLSQALYLASVLPAPQLSHFSASGALSGGWISKLRTLMKYANKRNRVSDDELSQGLSEIPVRGSPTPMKDPNARLEEGSVDDPTDPANFQLQ